MPKLSIITINLNNADGLRRTIESVVNQVIKDVEYIVIDGASTDGSIDIIKEYEDKIYYWISEPDSGIYNAMNKGIRIAKGEYCQFLNSGDYLADEFVVEKMFKNLPDSSVIYGNLLKKTKNKVFYNKEIPVNSLLTFYTGTLNHSSSYIKRSLFEKYGFYDESLKIVSDWKFFMIAIGLNNEKVEYKDIDVCYFKMGGISNTNHHLEKRERAKVLREVLPSNIMSDYKNYATFIYQMKRLNRFKITKWVIWFIERLLFKIEKVETKIKRKQIFY